MKHRTLPRALFPSVLVLLIASCGGKGSIDLCRDTFTPYPDLVTGRVVQERHRRLLDGMEHYAKGRYDQAIETMKEYSFDRGSNKAAHLYLAMSYLAIGKPFDAELHLDHLRNSNLEGFSDQVEWYTVVCWLCSDQLERARDGALRIAGKRHTYQREAAKLAKALEDR
jgi:hypothetical protein